MPRLRLATLRRQSRVSARRFSRLSCACATAPPRGFACRRTRFARSEYSHALVLTASRSGSSLRSLIKPLSRFYKGALAFRALAPACLRRHGAARGSLAPPPCVRAAALRVCSHGGASRLSCRFFAFFALAARAGAPMQGLFTRLRSSLRVLRPSRLTQSNKTGILYN